MAISGTSQRTAGVSEDEALDLLRQVVPIRCEPDALGITEGELVAFYAGKMREFGLEVEVFEQVEGRPNVVGRVRGAGGGKSILFNTHLLAPVAPEEDWRYDPWAVTLEDGKLYGTAVSDPKCGAVAMLFAARDLARNRSAGDVIVGFGAGGEKGGFIGTKAIVERGYRADVAVVCEPSELDIVIAQYGAVWADFTIKGKQGFVDAGVSALQKGVTVYHALVEMNKTVNQRTHPLVPPSKIAVNALQAGSHWAIVPDRCVVKADRRIIPGETVEGTVAEMEALLDRLRQQDPALDVTMEIDTALPPIETPTDSLIVQEAVAAITEVRGAAPQLKGIKGFTELVHIYQAGIPGIVLGPGSPSVIHAANEYVPLQEYLQAIDVYTSLARRITSLPAS